MINQNENSSDADLLRHKAAEQLQMRKDNVPHGNNQSSEKDLLKLVHELEVHQIELEMQNEELIFAKRKAELAEDKYTELYDFAPSGYLTITKDGIISELNFMAANMLGKDRSSLQNSLFSFYISVETRLVFSHFLEKVFKSKTKEACDVMLAVSGQPLTYVSLTGIYNENEKCCRVSATDITDCKLIDEKLKESEIQYRNLADSGSALIWTSGLDKLCNYFNLPWLKFTGRTLEQEMGNGWAEGVHPDDFDRCLETYVSAFDKQEPFEMEYRLLHSSGEYKWILDLGAPNFNRMDEFVGYIGHCFDISDRKYSELLIQRKTKEIAVQNEELIIAKERAEESDRLKSAFLANMSHEIRTPMNGILGFTDLLRIQDLSNDKRDSYIEIIHRSGQRLLDTVNDIVEISKIEAGLVVVNKSEFNINNEIEELIKFFRPQAEWKGLILIYEKPVIKSNATVNTDIRKFESILTNLIKNAIKFTDEGLICVGASVDSNSINCYVKDTGIGIPLDRLEAVFNRFEQADIKDLRAKQGSGLGLAISKAYVEMLGGKIMLQSKENEGSEFKFTIPSIKETGDSFIKIVDGTGIIEDKDLKSKKLKILVAEDDDISYLYLETIMAEVNCDLVRCTNGVDTVKEFERCRDFDMIIMDVKMPVMNGLDATREIRKIDNDVKIIANSAYALLGDKEAALEAGCNDYLTKPLRKDNILLSIGILKENLQR